jgi:hypothetical protein
VAILQVALRLLSNENQAVREYGWNIICTAVQSDITPVLVALLGSKPRLPVEAIRFEFVENPRILDHISDLGSIIVSRDDMKRFGESVILRLADKDNSDIRFLALSICYAWCLDGLAAPKLFQWINDFTSIPTRQDKLQLYQDRWKSLAHSLVRMTGLLTRANLTRTTNIASPQLVVDTIANWCKQYDLHTGRANRVVRALIRGNLDYILNLLPAAGPIRYYTPEIEQQLMQPLKSSRYGDDDDDDDDDDE